MRVLGTKVLVKETNSNEARTKAGLFVPDNAQKKYKEGVVVEVGDGEKDVVMNIAKDDKIIFSEFGGTPVTIESEKYIVIDRKDILVVL